MLFNKDHRNGIPDLAAADLARQSLAKAVYTSCVRIADAGLTAGKKMWWEGPVSRGTDSPFAIVGQELHSTAFEMDIMVELIKKHRLRPTYVDQGTLGASSPKTTEFWSSEDLHPQMQRTLGVLPTAAPTGKQTVGFTPDGHTSNAAELARYPPRLMQLLGQMHASLLTEQQTPREHLLQIPQHNEVSVAETQMQQVHQQTDQVPMQVEEEEDKESNGEPTQEHISSFEHTYPEGSRVRVKWENSPSDYYEGVVKAYATDIDGEHVMRVRYDDGKTLYHNTRQEDIQLVQIPTGEHDTDGVDMAGYEPFLAPIVTNLHNDDREETDDLVSFMQQQDLRMLCAALGTNHRKSFDDFYALAESPGIYVAEYQLYDIENGDMVQKEMITVTDGKKAVEIDLHEAARMHEPKGEKQFRESPQHAQWQTARELKMESYT